MKLIVTIEAEESEIKAAINGIPPHWLSDPGASPIRLLALALKRAYEKPFAEIIRARQ